MSNSTDSRLGRNDEMSDEKWAVTASALAEAVVEVANERPDYVYEVPNSGICLFQVDGKPSCIVGHALARLGAPAELLETLDAEELSIDPAFVEVEALKCDVDREVEFLQRVQLLQDGGTPWGEAVRRARSDMRRLSWI